MHHLSVLIDKLKSDAKNGVLLKTERNKEFSVSPITKDGDIIGVNVSNLGNANRFLSIEVFVAVISLLELSPGKRAIFGKVMRAGHSFKLGDPELPLNSIEGHVAKVIYGKNVGDILFKRTTPISYICEWAGICEIVRPQGEVPRGLRLLD